MLGRAARRASIARPLATRAGPHTSAPHLSRHASSKSGNNAGPSRAPRPRHSPSMIDNAAVESARRHENADELDEFSEDFGLASQRIDLSKIPTGQIDPLKLAQATEDDEAFQYGTEKSMTGVSGHYDILRPDSTYDGGERYYFNEPLSPRSPPRPHGSQVLGFESAWLGAAQDYESTRWRALEQFYSANAVRERAAQATIDLWLEEQEEIRSQRAAGESASKKEWLSGTAASVFQRTEELVDEELASTGASRETTPKKRLAALKAQNLQRVLQDLKQIGPSDVSERLLKELHTKFDVIFEHMELVARHRLDAIRSRHVDPEHVEEPVNWESVGALLGRTGESLRGWARTMENRSRFIKNEKKEQVDALLKLKTVAEELADMARREEHEREDPTEGGAPKARVEGSLADPADMAALQEEETGPDSTHGKMRQRVREMLGQEEFDDPAARTGEAPATPYEGSEGYLRARERMEDAKTNVYRMMTRKKDPWTREEVDEYLTDRVQQRQARRERIAKEANVLAARAAPMEARETMIEELRRLEAEEREEREARIKKDEAPRTPQKEKEEQTNKSEFKPVDFIPYSAKYMQGLMAFPLILRRTTQMTGKGKINNNYMLVVVGNGNGLVGVGEGKDMESFLRAQDKAFADAVRNMDVVERFEERTIWTDVEDKLGATRIIMRPRPVGFGLRCNPYIHQILKAAGVKDISAKVWGSRNPLSVIKTVTRMLHAGHAPVQFGSGTLGRGGRRMEAKQGVRGKAAVERERGRKLIAGRAW